jgi:hypothetical protein
VIPCNVELETRFTWRTYISSVRRFLQNVHDLQIQRMLLCRTATDGHRARVRLRCSARNNYVCSFLVPTASLRPGRALLPERRLLAVVAPVEDLAREHTADPMTPRMTDAGRLADVAPVPWERRPRRRGLTVVGVDAVVVDHAAAGVEGVSPGQPHPAVLPVPQQQRDLHFQPTGKEKSKRVISAFCR